MSAPDPFRIAFVCTGNICRSPMGEVILRSLVEDAGLDDRFRITSRGTGDWHVGGPAHARTRSALSAAGYDGEAHRAAQLAPADLAENDLIVALDRGHERALRSLGAEPDRVVLLTAFDPERPEDPDVFDPYHSDDATFRRVRDQIERSCVALLAELRNRLGV